MLRHVVLLSTSAYHVSLTDTCLSLLRARISFEHVALIVHISMPRQHVVNGKSSRGQRDSQFKISGAKLRNLKFQRANLSCDSNFKGDVLEHPDAGDLRPDKVTKLAAAP
ncbi:hypothetical protein PIB30_095391 [Stylosanthes scabra]|uniref:Uncharacterized protein n=1 Tax=Stylosanthes scabra TaxID=79078 RepID=A0ABU6TWC9_9FABA|nr:hypothetical protein [Stylosanthes scabra]